MSSASLLPSVLFVDDEDSTRKTLALILTMHGFVVSTATSGEEAIELARQSSPDWVLSDIIMGGITGIEAASRSAGFVRVAASCLCQVMRLHPIC